MCTWQDSTREAPLLAAAELCQQANEHTDTHTDRRMHTPLSSYKLMAIFQFRVFLLNLSRPDYSLQICIFINTNTQPFNGPLSRTTRAGRYQKKHSLTPILIINHQELVNNPSVYRYSKMFHFRFLYLNVGDTMRLVAATHTKYQINTLKWNIAQMGNASEMCGCQKFPPQTIHICWNVIHVCNRSINN